MKSFLKWLNEGDLENNRENWRDTLDQMAAKGRADDERMALAAQKQYIKKRQGDRVRSALEAELGRIFQELQAENIPRQLISHELAVLADKAMTRQFP